MIHITDIVHKIESFLYNKHEDRFKIFVRINFSVDVYILSDNSEIALNYQKDFLDSLSSDFVDDFYEKHKDTLRIKFNVIDSETYSDDPFYDNMFRSNFTGEEKNELHIG